MPNPGWIRIQQQPRKTGNGSSGAHLFSPPGRQCRAVLQEEGYIRAQGGGDFVQLPGRKGAPNSSFNPSSVVAALPLPPPNPAAMGICFSRCSRTPSLIPAFSRNAAAAR